MVNKPLDNDINFTVLGIDPGSNATGIALIKVENSEESLIHYEAIIPSRASSFRMRICEVHNKVRELIDYYRPSLILIENNPFNWGKFQQAGSRLANVTGAIMCATQQCRFVYTVVPTSVKKKVTGNGRATKSQVKKAILDKGFKIRTKNHDVSDALAIALCYQDQHDFFRCLNNENS